jgi:hypothetical protein
MIDSSPPVVALNGNERELLLQLKQGAMHEGEFNQRISKTRDEIEARRPWPIAQHPPKDLLLDVLMQCRLDSLSELPMHQRTLTVS